MKRPAVLERIERDLEQRAAHKLFRRTATAAPSPERDLSTNSYLSLHTDPTILRNAHELCGADLSGNLASRLIAARSPLYEQLETELAAWKLCESALVFNSGYAANLGILQALCGRETEVFSDRLNHASIVDGIRLAGSKMNRYGHCNPDDLRQRLQNSNAREKLIVTDTVFSMDGDRAPLAAICEMAEEYGALVMVDEAHASGIFGAQQSGLVEELGVEERVAVRMGTLSKAVAGVGGFFAGSALLRDFLVNNARSLIYSTALPQAALAFDLAAVRAIRCRPGVGRDLLERAGAFRERLMELGFDTLQSTTQIIPCVTGDEATALALSQELSRHGIAVPAVRPPTVPTGTARLRFSIHAGVGSDVLEEVLALLRRWKERHG